MASAPRCWWRSRPAASTPWARTWSTTASTTSWSTAPRRSRSWTTSPARGSAWSRSPASSRGSRGAAGPTTWRWPAARRRRCRACTSRAPSIWPAPSSAWSRKTRRCTATRIVPGDVLLGYASTGLHTNGYTLARRIVFDRMKLGLDDRLGDTGRAVADALLAVHRSYLPSVCAGARPGAWAGAHHRRRDRRQSGADIASRAARATVDPGVLGAAAAVPRPAAGGADLH